MALRLPAPPRPPGHGPAPGPGPVVLFLPAHDEEATVADVVARAPERVRGRRVECLVVDDGSGDRTAELAAAAGATVLSSAVNRGLGAAVRRGLAAATERGAAAVAFCDADREYDPAELERLVAPILEGRADYVVGSRFAGEIRRMLPQRRLGNRALTGLLRYAARTPIGDGQSGFRALSGPAAAAAEIAHDYNYAQVLTLDLLAKGHRYLEVPIGYQFRTSGRSFVRPLRYLRQVVPTVWRELDRHRARASPDPAPLVPAPGATHPAPGATDPAPGAIHPAPPILGTRRTHPVRAGSPGGGA
jgi:glycosyltransferase involved in cell wall biosynthesis